MHFIVLTILSTLFLLPVSNAEARTAMDRCYENFASNKARLFDCMKASYEKREDARLMIEEEISSLANNYESKTYTATVLANDLSALFEGKSLFEQYRKLECDRQKSFMDRKGPEAQYAHFVCLYDMTTQRIRALQNSVKVE